jgi:ribonuclease III
MSSSPAPQKVFNPWNPKNREMTPSDAIHIMRHYGWKGRIHNFHLFSQACCHKSYVDRPELWQEQAEDGEEMMIAPRPDDCLPLRKCDNEELEYLGDRVLGLVVATYVSKRYPGQGEGFLTRILSRVVNNKQLGKLAKDVGMPPWLILSRHMEEICDGRNNLRILGSMFEAWIGAMYLQEDDVGRGLQQCNDFLVRVIEKHIDFVQIIIEDTNYKDQLLRKFQAMYHVPPRYKEIYVVGPPHDRIFTMGVLDPADQVIATATARNKKVAEQEASRLALEKLDPSLGSLGSLGSSSSASDSRSSSPHSSSPRSSSSTPSRVLFYAPSSPSYASPSYASPSYATPSYSSLSTYGDSFLSPIPLRSHLSGMSSPTR